MANETRLYTVYIHVSPNGKRYIGITRNKPENRWRNGRGYRNTSKFASDIDFFGWNKFKHIIFAKNVCEDKAKEIEIELIRRYDTQNPEHGYNTKKGGQVFDKHSNEFINSASERMHGNTYCIGRKLSQNHIEALRKSRLGKSNPSKYKGINYHTDEAKKAISNKAKKRYQNPEFRQKMLEHRPDYSGENNPMYGKHHSEETKQKIREKATGRRMSEEQHIKIKKSHEKYKKPVSCFDKNMNLIKKYDGASDAAEDIRGTRTNITFACKNVTRTYRGMYWRYADEK